MRKLYVFGNEYLEVDSVARKVAACLEEAEEKIEIIHCRGPEELLEAPEEEIWILDVATGIDSPRLLEDASLIKTRQPLSLHDFDLGYLLRLLEALGTPKNVKIIALPTKGEPRELAQKISQWIRTPE